MEIDIKFKYMNIGNYRTESDYLEANKLNNKSNETNIKFDNCGLCGKSILLFFQFSKLNI